MADAKYLLTVKGVTKTIGQWVKHDPSLRPRIQSIRGRASGRNKGDTRFSELTDFEVLYGKKTLEGSSDLTGYLEAAVKESLELYAPVITRALVSKLQVGKSMDTPASAAYRIGEDIQFSNELSLADYLKELCGNDPRRMLLGTHEVPDKAVIMESIGLLPENDSEFLTPFEAAQLLMME